jgi:hypothetical protein
VTDAPVAEVYGHILLRQARREAFWKKSSVLLVAATGLFLFGLLGFSMGSPAQDRFSADGYALASNAPGICQPSIVWVRKAISRRVEALVIDSSSANLGLKVFASVCAEKHV